MIGTTKRYLRKVLCRSQATEDVLTNTLVSIEAALNSGPITQEPEDALTHSHFRCGAKPTTLLSTKEPQKEDNLKKTHQKTKRMADDYWRRWEKEYLMELRSFHVVSEPKWKSGKAEPETSSFSKISPPQTFVEEGPGGGTECGKRRSHENDRTPRANGNVLVRSLQLLIPLVVEQGGVDVEDP